MVIHCDIHDPSSNRMMNKDIKIKNSVKTNMRTNTCIFQVVYFSKLATTEIFAIADWPVRRVFLAYFHSKMKVGF
jgi:hypothetical protein